MSATWLAIILATIGPFIYKYLSQQAEQLLFSRLQDLAATEQIRRHKSLDYFSASMAHEIVNPVCAAMGGLGVFKESWCRSEAIVSSSESGSWPGRIDEDRI